MLACVLVGTAWLLRHQLPPVYNLSASLHSANRSGEEFPEVDTTTLSPLRRDIITLAAREHQAQSPGTTYSQGAVEPWCANFLSWIMREAGAPLTNPHSGGWRIPGTYTLREYYESTGQFRPAGSDYQPQPGDAVLYRGSLFFGDHVNIVLVSTDGRLTTVGGNENNAIRVTTHAVEDDPGFIGYGVAE